MTLEPLQRRVAAILKARRTPNSFVGGAAVLNETRPRVSDDLDIYAEDRPIVEIAEADIAALRSEGLKIEWRRDHYGFAIEAQVSDGAASTMLEWSEADQERFFPVQPHATFGWALHPLDLAVQKLIAAATRRQARDVCDLIEIEASGAPLAALALAAPAKFPGVSPAAMLQRARMNAMGLPAEDFDALRFDWASPDVPPARSSSTSPTASSARLRRWRLARQAPKPGGCTSTHLPIAPARRPAKTFPR